MGVCKNGRPYLRHLVNNLHYPEDIQGEVHADGKIWGAVLWISEMQSVKLIQMF